MHPLVAKTRHLVGGWVGQQLWQALGPEWVLASGLTVQVKTHAEWVIYNDIFVNREYDDAIREVVDDSTPDPVVVDLGANVGFFGLRFADLWLQKNGGSRGFRLVGVEGSPAVYRTLETRMRVGHNAELLGGHARYHFGLAGERSGETFISTSFFHVTNSIAGARSRFGSMVSFLDVEALLPPGARIALLKCDIEGAEELFLRTYPDLLERIDRVVIELHQTRCDVGRCIELLKAAGLRRHVRVRDCSPDFTVDRFSRA